MILVECDCCKYSLVTVVDLFCLLKKKDRISSTITTFCLENAVCNDERTNRSKKTPKSRQMKRLANTHHLAGS